MRVKDSGKSLVLILVNNIFSTSFCFFQNEKDYLNKNVYLYLIVKDCDFDQNTISSLYNLIGLNIPKTRPNSKRFMF